MKLGYVGLSYSGGGSYGSGDGCGEVFRVGSGGQNGVDGLKCLQVAPSKALEMGWCWNR